MSIIMVETFIEPELGNWTLSAREYLNWISDECAAYPHHDRWPIYFSLCFGDFKHQFLLMILNRTFELLIDVSFRSFTHSLNSCLLLKCVCGKQIQKFYYYWITQCENGRCHKQQLNNFLRSSRQTNRNYNQHEKSTHFKWKLRKEKKN